MTDQEINEAVAVKLGEDVRHGGIFVQGGDWGEEMDESHPIPDYCHSIEAAWEIVEHIKDKGGRLGLLLEANGGWRASFKMSPSDYLNGHHDTAPMAICKAFLKLDGLDSEAKRG